MAHRFDGIEIAELTFDNYQELLPASLASQVEKFLPPEGFFDEIFLRLYVQTIREFEL